MDDRGESIHLNRYWQIFQANNHSSLGTQLQRKVIATNHQSS